MKKYSVIYADPPWRYKVYSKKGLGRSAESHYPTMSLEDIKALPIGELAAKDCALFMWITFPCMQEAFQVLEAWGFEYKTTAFVWIKQNRVSDSLFWGMGYWTRANAELCILATKGHPKRASPGVHQVIMSHIEEHSKKPEEARNRIVQLMGDVPRIELFARQSPEGWDVWGNEVECSITLGKEVPNGVCTGPEGPESCQDEGHVQPDKAAAHLLCAGCGSGCPIFFLTKPSLGISTSAMLMVVIMLPFIFFALYEKDGQPAEKILGHVIKSMFLRDKVRPYRTSNLYAAIQQEIKEKEELQIAQQHEKGRRT